MTDEAKSKAVFGVMVLYHDDMDKPEVHFKGRPDGVKVQEALRHIVMAYKDWQKREYMREENERNQEQKEDTDNDRGRENT